jgi:hypothetical protein
LSFGDGLNDGLSITGYASQATINGILYDDYIIQAFNNGANGTGTDLAALSLTIDTSSQNYSSSVGALYINTAPENGATQPDANVFGTTNVSNGTDPNPTDALFGDAFGYPQAGTFIGIPDRTYTETNYLGFQSKMAYINGNTNTQNGGHEGAVSNVLFKPSVKANGTNGSIAAIPIDAAYLAGAVHSLETVTVINPATDFTDISGGAPVANIVVPNGTVFTITYSMADSNGTNKNPQSGIMPIGPIATPQPTTLSLGWATNPVVGGVVVTGAGNGIYNPAVTTITPTSVGSVMVNGFSPFADGEIFALEIQEGGTIPSPADLAAIVAQLRSTGATLTLTDPTGGAFKPDSFFDLFAEIPQPGAYGDTALNFDLTGFTGLTGAGPVTLAAVGAVPEPSEIGVLAFASFGLLARRRRRAT